MKWLKDHISFFYIFVLFALTGLLVGFFISKNHAVRAAVAACDSSGDRVIGQSFNTQVYISVYRNAPFTPFNIKPEDEHIPILPIWIVNMNAYWKL